MESDILNEDFHCSNEDVEMGESVGEVSDYTLIKSLYTKVKKFKEEQKSDDDEE
jgi:hypothetical protein